MIGQKDEKESHKVNAIKRMQEDEKKMATHNSYRFKNHT